ncbi:hypothetical protein C1645_878667 [Glomus cerebriforme]|uniref:Copper transporter n=1 Tax=Glomus cerebriforme TaxID=658196 RepID=A0A397SU63_9GLOM|nr:hypothetical protein C1645_878667 [Glomus cerebriforme]
MSETIPGHTSSAHFDHNKLYLSSDLSKVVTFFSDFQVNSIFLFVLASFFVTFLCWSERFLNYYYHKKLNYDQKQKRFKLIVMKTLSYGLLTTLRLFYMLIIMSMNSQIFIIVVTSLTTGQLIVEYIRSIPIYQQYEIPSSSETTLENSSLVRNIDNYKDELEVGSRNFVIEDIDNETNEDIEPVT